MNLKSLQIIEQYQALKGFIFATFFAFSQHKTGGKALKSI